MAYVLPYGTTATLTDSGGANSLTLALVSITGASLEKGMVPTQGLSKTKTYIPGSLEKGEASFTCYVEDTATATNAVTKIRTRATAETLTVLNIDLPGSSIDDLFDVTGYIKTVTDPVWNHEDKCLEFTTVIKVTD